MSSHSQKKNKLEQQINIFQKQNPKYEVIYNLWSCDGGITKNTQEKDINEEFVTQNPKITIVEKGYYSKAYKFSDKMYEIIEEVGKGMKPVANDILYKCSGYVQEAIDLIKKKELKKAVRWTRGVSNYVHGEDELMHYMEFTQWSRRYSDIMEGISQLWIYLLHQEPQSIGLYNDQTVKNIMEDLKIFQLDMNKSFQEYHEEENRNPQIQIFQDNGNIIELSQELKEKWEKIEKKSEESDEEESDNDIFLINNNLSQLEKNNIKMEKVIYKFRKSHPEYQIIQSWKCDFGITNETPLEDINEEFLLNNKQVSIIEEFIYEKSNNCTEKIEKILYKEPKGYKIARFGLVSAISRYLGKVGKLINGEERNYKKAFAYLQGVSSYLKGGKELFWSSYPGDWDDIIPDISEYYRFFFTQNHKSLGFYNEQTKLNIIEDVKDFQKVVNVVLKDIYGENDKEHHIQIFENELLLKAGQEYQVLSVEDCISQSSKMLSEIKLVDGEEVNKEDDDNNNQAQVAMNLKKIISRQSSRKKDIQEKLCESRNCQQIKNIQKK